MGATPPSRHSPKNAMMSTIQTSSIISCDPPKTKQYMDSLVPPTPEDFERIASVQREREDKQKQKTKELMRQSLDAEAQHQQDNLWSGYSKDEKSQAAHLIQRTFRGYRTRREMQGFGLDASTRWVSAIREAQFREIIQPRTMSAIDENNPSDLDSDPTQVRRASTARMKWKKASIVARRANEVDKSDSSSHISFDDSTSQEDKTVAKTQSGKVKARREPKSKMMGIQYFLEMVDLKHRYGSSLRMYHEEWKRSSTKENFFYWLDYGEGRNVELEACPRDRLERERVRYLSREERQYYLVQIDSEGRLCWAKNGQRIDTTVNYKDSIHGVVPSDDPTPPFNPELESHRYADSSSSSDSALEHEREADRAAKYATPEFDERKGIEKVTHLSTATVFNKLLRKSVRKNTWIFIADTSFRLYVGIKNSGAFQHSSFLQGSRISAAGLIKIKNGRLASLSPLSGHYRPPVANFRAFVQNLREEGVDLSHVSTSKSYAVLVGLEAYVKTRQRGKRVLGKIVHGRDKIIAPDEVARREEEARDKSESAEKERRALEKEEAERLAQREAEGTKAKVMQKLGIVRESDAGESEEAARKELGKLAKGEA